jgi:hypothetical protein
VALKNSKLLDPDKGLFSVLELVAIQLAGSYWWNGEDINDELYQRAIFRAYDPETVENDELDIASITVVDATSDPTEPDVSLLKKSDVKSLDESLCKSIRAGLEADGMELQEWMSSQLNQSDELKMLITAYKVKSQGKERQFIAARFRTRGHKIVTIGIFDIDKKELLAVPIFNIIRNMQVKTD